MYSGTITADLHIAEKFDIAQIERLLLKIADYANTTNELIICGDIFHNSKVSPLELLTFINFIKRVRVPIIMVAGNHDTAGENTILDWMPKVLPLEVFGESKIIRREGLDILLGHYNVDESVLGAYDFKIKTGISVNQLTVPLALLGHIHKPQHIQGEKTQVVHPGSIFYIDYNERNESKSFIHLVVNQDKYQINHIPLDPDPIVQLDITPDTTGEILKDYGTNTRIKLVVKYSDPTLNKREVIKKFDKYHFKDKKFSFIYDSPAPLNSLQKDTENTMIDLEEFLKEHTSSEVIQLIQKALKESK